MKITKKLILLFLLLQGVCSASFAQPTCSQGQHNKTENSSIFKRIGDLLASIFIQSTQPIDPNEIIGLDGYNAPESADTLRWASATQSLAYTIYFQNDAELAMVAVSKVSITMPLHEKLNFATFGVGSTYIRSSKSFMVASLTCVHDIMLEIPLAHCVRGGMVRFADGRVGKRRAASENVPLPVTSSSPPFFFPFCLQVRNTIPRNVTTLSGISSDWQQTSKKCSLT